MNPTIPLFPVLILSTGLTATGACRDVPPRIAPDPGAARFSDKGPLRPRGCLTPNQALRSVVARLARTDFAGAAAHALFLPDPKHQRARRGHFTALWTGLVRELGAYQRILGVSGLKHRHALRARLDLRFARGAVRLHIQFYERVDAQGCLPPQKAMWMVRRPLFDPVKASRWYVEHLALRDFRAVARRFYPYPPRHMLTHWNPIFLRRFWDDLTERAGAFRRIEGVRSLSAATGNLRTVVVRCRFARGAVDITLAVSVASHGLGTGFTRPQAQLHVAPPSSTRP